MRARRTTRVAAPVAALALAVAGCGAGDGSGAAATTAAPLRAAAPPARKAPARPALCGPVRVRVTGHVASDQATELSGLVASPDRPGVLWAHNDSGDRPRILGFRTDGSAVADLDVPGAEAADWEDVAVGPGAGGGHALYLADIGDNREARETIDVYRVPEPAAGATGATAPAERLRLRYPDGRARRRDAPGRPARPRAGDRHQAAQRRVGRVRGPPAGGRAGCRAADAPRTPRRCISASAGWPPAGDVSADGRVVVVRTYTGFVAWTVARGASLAATLRRAPVPRERSASADEGQGEALALTAHGTAFFTVPEGADPAIRRYAAARR